MKGLTDIAGIKVGHVSDFEGLTGCTAILCEGGAVGGCDIRGGASGSAEMDTLSPWHVTDKVHGVCLAGGSAFGLEAGAGVRRYLEHKGVGFRFGGAVVPIVPAAILFDLGIGKGHARPTREMGEAAAAAATGDAVTEGCIGAGTGATVGKALGRKNAMKSGLGTFTVEAAGALVSALVVVNAFGDVVEPKTGKIVAGVRKSEESREFANAAQIVKRGPVKGEPKGGNTTLAVVATNARLTKVQAGKLAQYAQQGFVRAISPVHTMGDGDLAVALSAGDREAPIDSLGVAAAEAVAEAIVRAVRAAKTMGGLPGLAGL
jgi:L-aminopeptidase/D-esterase-like protein